MKTTTASKPAKFDYMTTVCCTRRTGVNFGHVGEVRRLTKEGPGRLLAETEGTYPTAYAAMAAARKLTTF